MGSLLDHLQPTTFIAPWLNLTSEKFHDVPDRSERAGKEVTEAKRLGLLLSLFTGTGEGDTGVGTVPCNLGAI